MRLKSISNAWEILQSDNGTKLWLTDGKSASRIYVYPVWMLDNKHGYITDFEKLPATTEDMISKYVDRVCDDKGEIKYPIITRQLRPFDNEQKIL